MLDYALGAIIEGSTAVLAASVLLQIDGTKELFLFHPNESHHFYSDFHNKFGLSPISADRVDLDRYPDFARAATHRMLLRPGDLGYIPDGWWHLVKSHRRNVAVAIEFEPFSRDGERVWPVDVLARYRWPGLFWAEQVRIKYEMRERLGATRYASATTGVPVRCESRLQVWQIRCDCRRAAEQVEVVYDADARDGRGAGDAFVKGVFGSERKGDLRRSGALPPASNGSIKAPARLSALPRNRVFAAPLAREEDGKCWRRLAHGGQGL